ncbi:MAG: DNA topoisomerase VI subunit B [Candidatus Micrarchaeia archaeon]
MAKSNTDKIFSNFKEHSVAEFFKKNKQMLGFSGKVRSLTTIVHEYVTNSIDACEEAGTLPEIEVKIHEITKNERYKVSVKDNGPGIPKKHLGKALGQMLAGTKFHRYAQQRGQQGIGAAGCTMYAQITTGKPVYVVSEYADKKLTCNVAVDIKTNSPTITDEVEEDNPQGAHGLYVEGEFGEVNYERSAQSPYEYIKRIALANPHVTISLLEPTGELTTYPRSSEIVPKKPKEVLPHPLGLGVSDIVDLAHRETDKYNMSSFLQERFQRVSSAKVDELAQVMSGKTEGIIYLDFKKKPSELSWEEAEGLIKAFSMVKWIAPASDCIHPIGAEQIQTSLAHILAPEFIAVTERPPKIYKGGVPFLVEAAIAWGGQAGRRLSNNQVTSDIIRYANAAPLLFDISGCAITQAAKDVDWKRYKLKNFEEEAITVFVNLASVHIPYTSAGKQAISQEDEVYQEIKNAIMEAARRLQLHLAGINKERDRAQRRNAVIKYVPQLSHDLSELAGKNTKPEELAKKLTLLIETKYMTHILGDESGEEGLEENGKEAEDADDEKEE